MPIAKGQPWGEPGPVPEGAVEVGSDAEAAAVVSEARRNGRPLPPLVLRGGDLRKTLGAGAGSSLLGLCFPIDLGEATLDGQPHLFVAHLVARSRLWTRAFVAMNAQWLGTWNLGPRAHPNDGLLDTYEVRLTPGQLAAVKSRLHHGAHLPHPGIGERRAGEVTVELDRPLPVRLDGVVTARASSIVVRAAADALVVAV